jgi:hypothetical protein
MFRKLALALFLLITAAVVAILAIASTRPPLYHVERSTTTHASPQVVYTIVNDMNRFHEWSPWQKLDPNMHTSMAGSGIGVGSTYAWTGEGRMSITEVVPGEQVRMKLEFLKPFASVCDVHFKIAPEGDGSRVTWAMDGTNNFVAKVMSMFVSMDAMIGKQFDSGLANLARVSEAAPASAAGTPADSTVSGTSGGAKR